MPVDINQLIGGGPPPPGQPRLAMKPGTAMAPREEKTPPGGQT